MTDLPITGTGFYLWKIDNLPADQAISALRRAGAIWVCIKVADGTTSSNAGLGDPYLVQYLQQLEDAGFIIGFWQFIYPQPTMSPGAQASKLGERVQKLKNREGRPFCKFILLDAEHVSSVGAYWKTLPDGSRNPSVKQSALTYLHQLRPGGVPKVIPTALSSYRFPSLHPPFPFKQFVNEKDDDGNEITSFIAPQMYWVGSHNPAEQLERCNTEYQVQVRAGLPNKPMVPIGAAFHEGGWTPYETDLTEFIDAAKNMGCLAWGFWELGFALRNHPNFLDVIGENITPPPPPTPPPAPQRVIITGLDGTDRLRVRDDVFGQVKFLADNEFGPYPVLAIKPDYLNRDWYEIYTSDRGNLWIASWYTKPAA